MAGRGKDTAEPVYCLLELCGVCDVPFIQDVTIHHHNVWPMDEKGRRQCLSQTPVTPEDVEPIPPARAQDMGVRHQQHVQSLAAVAEPARSTEAEAMLAQEGWQDEQHSFEHDRKHEPRRTTPPPLRVAQHGEGRRLQRIPGFRNPQLGAHIPAWLSISPFPPLHPCLMCQGKISRQKQGEDPRKVNERTCVRERTVFDLGKIQILAVRGMLGAGRQGCAAVQRGAHAALSAGFRLNRHNECMIEARMPVKS